MEQLESQIGEVRAFLKPEAKVTSIGNTTISHGREGGSTRSAHGTTSASTSPIATTGRKRQADEDTTSKSQRAKRTRYISLACNECKRRKIKCSGQQPCGRCGNLDLECVYAPNCCPSSNVRDSDEFQRVAEQVARLQESVDTLWRGMSELRSERLELAPIKDRMLPPLSSTTGLTPSPSMSHASPRRHDYLPPPFRAAPAFRGPTSSTFTVNIAKNTLHGMGYGDESSNAPAETAPVPSPLAPPSSRSEPPNFARDPLFDFDKDEIIRLVRLHEEEVGIMYPVVRIADVIAHAQDLSLWMERMRQSRQDVSNGSDMRLDDIETLQLKIIMCCALAVEEHGYSAKAVSLWESIEDITNRLLMSESSEVTKLPFLALVAGYRFLSNEEILAWRVMGQVARLCLEMGLHRRDGISRIEGEQERKNAINTFWSAYVLDRRWAFGTGLPFVVHDDKIDPELPYPIGHPYLAAMITHSKLGAKIWKLVDYFDPVLIRDLKHNDFERLDAEILEWYQEVPPQIRIASFNTDMPIPGTQSYNLERQQMWTRLRLNQIRVWLHTPVLHSASSITQNLDLAQRVVDLAKETIRCLSQLNRSSNVYRRIQVFYHQFLTSAIAVLFLASTHAPVHFSAQCREEFNMALELIKDLSPKSFVSRRLWRTVASLKAYAPKLGLGWLDRDTTSRNAQYPPQYASSANSNNGSMSSASPLSRPMTTVNPQRSLPASATVLPFQALPSPAYNGNGNAGASATDKERVDNGLKLHDEMSRILESFLGLAQADRALGNASDAHGHVGVSQYETHPRPHTSASEKSTLVNGRLDEGVYGQLRDLF